MGRSILAVVVGFVFIAALSIAGDLAFRAIAPENFDAAGRAASTGALLITLAYVAVIAITGCYICGRLAPSRPMRHALILGLLGLVVNVVGAIAMWDAAPAWYYFTAIALVMPYAGIGGWLAERHRPGSLAGVQPA